MLRKLRNSDQSQVTVSGREFIFSGLAFWVVELLCLRVHMLLAFPSLRLWANNTVTNVFDKFPINNSSLKFKHENNLFDPPIFSIIAKHTGSSNVWRIYLYLLTGEKSENTLHLWLTSSFYCMTWKCTPESAHFLLHSGERSLLHLFACSGCQTPKSGSTEMFLNIIFSKKFCLQTPGLNHPLQEKK